MTWMSSGLGHNLQKSKQVSMASETSEQSVTGMLAGEAEQERRKKIIEQEEYHVRKARFAVTAAIIGCAVAVSAAVFVFAARSESNSFIVEVSQLQEGTVVRER
jgi:hypothetical protein